jgi:hypothetical protein
MTSTSTVEARDEGDGGAERAWELLRTGRLDRTGMWHELAPEDRHAWLSVALWSLEYQRQGKPDASVGQAFTLDGRHIVDRDSFYCAIGEAINGPADTSAGTWMLWTAV